MYKNNKNKTRYSSLCINNCITLYKTLVVRYGKKFFRISTIINGDMPFVLLPCIK